MARYLLNACFMHVLWSLHGEDCGSESWDQPDGSARIPIFMFRPCCRSGLVTCLLERGNHGSVLTSFHTQGVQNDNHNQ